MVNAGRNYALFAILTLKAFGLLDQAIALYGTKAHMYRCFLLGETVSFDCNGQLFVTDREVWSATWQVGAGDWQHQC